MTRGRLAPQKYDSGLANHAAAIASDFRPISFDPSAIPGRSMNRYDSTAVDMINGTDDIDEVAPIWPDT
jgi:hypothetical protein